MNGERSRTSRTEALFDPVPTGRPTLFGVPRLTECEQLPDVVFVGVPYGVPYRGLGPELASAQAPAALRRASLAVQPYYRNYDIDFDAEPFTDAPLILADAGDVHLEPGDHRGNLERIASAIRFFLREGWLPIVLGGDHAVTVPVLQAYLGVGPFVVVQIDAHLDWRDEVEGVREGYSSPMRRASELADVVGMVQIGLRGAGSARREEVLAARTWGSVLLPARLVHERGVEWALAQIPPEMPYYVTIDADGIDPAIMPGVNAPTPGGLTYWQMFDLLTGLARRGRIIGLDLVELAPSRDPTGITLAHAIRFLLIVLARLAEGRTIETLREDR